MMVYQLLLASLLMILFNSVHTKVAKLDGALNSIIDTSKNHSEIDLKVSPKIDEIVVNIDSYKAVIDKKDIENEINDLNTTEKFDVGEPLILTPFIKDGKIEEARTASRVDPALFLGIESYSGFFTVNKTYNSNVFFWYFPVEKNVSETPWIIWLQGGPGASSLSGMFNEIGPLSFDDDGLKRNPFSWRQNHSLLFIDNPIGSGFSFTENNAGYVRDMEGYSRHLYSTFSQFVEMFPELRTAPLFVAGESYAGKYVPALAMEIHKHKDTPKGNVNLQGIMVGNAYIDPSMLTKEIVPYQYFGLIDRQQAITLLPLQNSFNDDIAANRSFAAKYKWGKLISSLLLLSHQNHAYNYLKDLAMDYNYETYLSRTDVKKALHIGNAQFSSVSITANLLLSGEFLTSATSMYETLLEQYRVLAYCGQLDLIVPCASMAEQIRSWSWKGSGKFASSLRLPLMYKNKRAGYYKQGGGLTEVLVRGAGHMVPSDVPEESLHITTQWTHGLPLVTSARFLEKLTNELPELLNLNDEIDLSVYEQQFFFNM